MADPTLL